MFSIESDRPEIFKLGYEGPFHINLFPYKVHFQIINMSIIQCKYHTRPSEACEVFNQILSSIFLRIIVFEPCKLQPTHGIIQLYNKAKVMTTSIPFT